jgi:hypothetical protein
VLQHRRLAVADGEHHDRRGREPATQLVGLDRRGPALQGQPQGQLVHAGIVTDDHHGGGRVALVLQRLRRSLPDRRDRGRGECSTRALGNWGDLLGGLAGAAGRGDQHEVGRQAQPRQHLPIRAASSRPLSASARSKSPPVCGMPFGLAVAHQDQSLHATSIAVRRLGRKRAVDTFFAKRSKAAWLRSIW